MTDKDDNEVEFIEDDDWFGSVDIFDDDDDVSNSRARHEATLQASVDDIRQDNDDPCQIVTRLQRKMNLDNVQEYTERTRLVEAHMGNMAQCRGDRGEVLGQAGAIDALLAILVEIREELPPPMDVVATSQNAAVTLASACWAAIRDLACGSASNRSAVRDFVSVVNGTNGMTLLATYLKRYDGVIWTLVPFPHHLRLLTNIIGALRNVTHSTRENCVELHQCGVSSMLIWRLLHGEGQQDAHLISLPDPNKPWREAAFRAASTLINVAEKCNDCASMCGRDPVLIHILVESWGGTMQKTTQAALLHLGLVAILHAAKKELPSELYDPKWDDVLSREQERKRVAQRKEEERKRIMLLKQAKT